MNSKKQFKSYVLGNRSLERLQGVDDRLVAVVKKAISHTEQDFTVIEGLRDQSKQQQLIKEGKSWTMKSKHLTGRAVDLAPYPIDWNDRGKFKKIKDAMMIAAQDLGVKIRWGGDWNQNGSSDDEIKRGTYDAPHFELLD